MTPILVRGMHGAGDCVHQRAVMRALLARGHGPIYLETSWPMFYRDMPEVRCLNRGTTLRTQLKNAARERDRYYTGNVPTGIPNLRVWYTPETVRRVGSIVGAMMAECGFSGAPIDLSLSVPAEWMREADDWITRWQVSKPIMLYRPLVERTEWGGCRTRNPDTAAYAALVRSIRDRYCVVSVADLVTNVEWEVGEHIRADVECHAGELTMEAMVGLISRAALVLSSPGFAVVLGKALGTPTVCVCGGYERSQFILDGAREGMALGIDPINPCACFSHSHRCDKRIDLDAALARLDAFAAVPQCV